MGKFPIHANVTRRENMGIAGLQIIIDDHAAPPIVLNRRRL